MREERRPPFQRLSATELAAWVSGAVRPSAEFSILDVREPFEVELAALPTAVTIPLREIPHRIGELDPDRVWVVMCHHGVRSAQVCQFLAGHGFEQLHNLSGGIDAWSLEVDPTVPRY